MKIIALLLLLVALPVYAEINGTITFPGVEVKSTTGVYGYTVNICNMTADCHGYNCFVDYDGNAVSGTAGWCNLTTVTNCYHDGSVYASATYICITNTTYRSCSSGVWSGVTACSSGACVGGSSSCSTSNSTTNPSGTPGSNLTSTETKTFSTAANTLVILPFTQVTSPGITQIEITTKTAKAGVQISLAPASKPSGAADIVSSTDGKVYSYADISKTNVLDSDFSLIKIKFKVTALWLSQNAVDYNKVYLYRYSGGTWNRLTTTFKSNDTSNYFYEATSPGFSTFAVAGYKSTATVPVIPGAPSISIISPTSGQVVVGTSVDVTLSASGVTLASPKPNYVAGEGHFHVWLDGANEKEGPETTVTFNNVAEGNHTITVELRRSEHSVFSPPVTASVTFSVSRTPPPSTTAAAAAGGDVTTFAIVLVVVGVVGAGAYFMLKNMKVNSIVSKLPKSTRIIENDILDKFAKFLQSTGSAMQDTAVAISKKTGNAVQNAGSAVQSVGSVVQNAGSAVQNAAAAITNKPPEQRSFSGAYEYRGEANYQSYHPDAVEQSAKEKDGSSPAGTDTSGPVSA